MKYYTRKYVDGDYKFDEITNKQFEAIVDCYEMMGDYISIDYVVSDDVKGLVIHS